MSERKCSACGGTFRIGVRALVLDPSDGLIGAIVCPSCAKRAESIVAVQPSRYGFAHGQAMLDAERKHKTEVLAPFVASLEARCKAIRMMGVSAVGATKAEEAEAQAFREGQLEAFENVLAMLKEGRA